MWPIRCCFTIMQLNSFPKQGLYGPACPKPEQVIFPRHETLQNGARVEVLLKSLYKENDKLLGFSFT